MKQLIITLILAFFSTQVCGEAQIFKITANVQLVIEKGDITNCPVEAIVNAANEQLQGGAGVCGAIFKTAGWAELQEACNKYPDKQGVRCPTGQAKITKGFGLKRSGIKYIIHAVGPDCRIIKDIDQQDALLENAYKNSLILAEQNNIQSIAFPFISSAIYAFPKERAAQVALKAVLNHVRENDTKIKSVHFVLFSQEDFDFFCTMCQEIQL